VLEQYRLVTLHLNGRVRIESFTRDAERGTAEEIQRAHGGGQRRRQGEDGLRRESKAPDGHVRVGSRCPRVRRRWRCGRIAQAPCDHANLGLAPVLVQEGTTWDVFVPEHRKMRFDELVLARQVEPNLEQLERIRFFTL